MKCERHKIEPLDAVVPVHDYECREPQRELLCVVPAVTPPDSDTLLHYIPISVN